MMKSLFKSLFLILAGSLSLQAMAQSTNVTLTASSAKDAMVAGAGLAGNNYGNIDFMNVYHDDQTTPIIYRSFIHFNLSSIPQNAIITEAKLLLTPQSVDDTVNFGYYVERVDTTWDEGTITWNNQEGTFSSDRVICDTTDAQTDTTHHIDVKTHVQNMVNYPYNNHGWAIRLDDENQSGYDYGLSFYSTDHVNASYRPQLEITYVLPIEITSRVTHCTNGNTDGAVDLTVTGGSGNYDKFVLYRVDKKTGYTAREETTVITSLTSGVDNTSIDGSSLQPGLYRAFITDDLWTANTDYDNAHFKKIFSLFGRRRRSYHILYFSQYQLYRRCTDRK